MPKDPPNPLQTIYDRLLQSLGPQNWWPARTRDEIIIGAILAQNTAWANVERAIENLRQANALTLPAIHRLPTDDLAQLIRPAGTFRIKAQRLKKLTAWLAQHFDSQPDALFALGLKQARQSLLTVNGIGPETADAILLYAGQLPTFVVDAYTQRILRRHHLIPPTADYHHTKTLFESAIPPDVTTYNQYHALIVQLGKHHCRPKAKCQNCPLESMPHNEAL